MRYDTIQNTINSTRKDNSMQTTLSKVAPLRPVFVARRATGCNLRLVRLFASPEDQKNNDTPVEITREYREDDDVLNNLDQMVGQTTSQPKSSGSSQYIDDLPEIPRTEMSDAMKEKLRKEYYSLGGSPNKSMGGNYFLNIILVISFLAILSAALGYL